MYNSPNFITKTYVPNAKTLIRDVILTKMPPDDIEINPKTLMITFVYPNSKTFIHQIPVDKAVDKGKTLVIADIVSINLKNPAFHIPFS